MDASAYQALWATKDQPVDAWEAILARTTDPKAREHMQIAITARMHIEAMEAKKASAQ